MVKNAVWDAGGTKNAVWDAGGTKNSVWSDTFFWVDDDVDGLFNNANNWSSSSGGAGGLGVPTLQDKIVFDGGNVTNCRLNLAMTVGEIDMQAAYTGTIDGATDDLSHAITGDVTLDGTRFDMGDGTWTVSGNWDNVDVTTFNRNLSTLVMDGTSKNIVTGFAPTFHHITFSGTITIPNAPIASSVQFHGTCTVSGTLDIEVGRQIRTITDGAVFTGAGTVTGSGVYRAGADTTYSFNGTYTAAELRLDESTTLTVAPTIDSALVTFLVSGSGNKTLTFAAGTTTFTGDVIFNVNAANTNTVANNTNNPNLVFEGDVTLTETVGTLTWTKGTGTITFSGTTVTQTITTLNKGLEDFVMNKASGTVVIVDNTTTESLTLTAGIWDAATNDPNFTIAGDCIMDNTQTDMGDGTWTVSGNWDNKDVTTFNENVSTLVMDGAGKTFIGFSSNALENFTVSGTITITDAALVVNGICIISGTLTVNVGERLRIIGGGGDLQIEATGTVTGAGETQINNEGKISKQDGTLDTAQLNILAAHTSGTIVPATYESATVTFDNTGSGIRTLRLSSGTYIFTGNVVFLVNNSDGTVVDNATNNPTLEFRGNVTLTETLGTITWTKGTGAIKFTATSGTVNLTSLGKDLEAVAQDGPGSTLNFVDDLTATGLSACQGVIDYNVKTFTLSGTLLIDGSTGATVDLAGLAGSTFTANTATFNGTSIAARLDLKALADWFLTLTTDGSANFVDVSHSDASGGNKVTAMQSINSLNNQNWFFGGGPGLSGKTRYAEPWDRPSLRLYKTSLH